MLSKIHLTGITFIAVTTFTFVGGISALNAQQLLSSQISSQKTLSKVHHEPDIVVRKLNISFAGYSNYFGTMAPYIYAEWEMVNTKPGTSTGPFKWAVDWRVPYSNNRWQRLVCMSILNEYPDLSYRHASKSEPVVKMVALFQIHQGDIFDPESTNVFRVRADVERRVKETNETNNSATVQVIGVKNSNELKLSPRYKRLLLNDNLPKKHIKVKPAD